MAVVRKNEARLLRRIWRLERFIVRRPRTLSPLCLFEKPTLETRTGSFVKWQDGHERSAGDLRIHGKHVLGPPPAPCVPASYVARLRGAIVFGANSLTAVRRESLVIPSRDCAPEFEPWNFSRFIERSGSRWLLPENLRVRAERRERVGILVTNRLSFNHFHFIVESLQSVCLAETLDEIGTAPIVACNLYETRRDLLSFLAPRRRLIEVLPWEWCAFRSLYLPTIGAFSPDSGDYAALASYETEYLSDVRDRIVSHVRSKRPELFNGSINVLYVSRRRHVAATRAVRDVVNSFELEEYVASLGGRVIFPETMSAAEQVAVFNSARVVVGPTGAALANTVFCRPGTLCVSLHQNAGVNPWYVAALARALKLEWRIAVGGGVGTEGADEAHARSYVVPLETLVDALSGD